MTRRLVRLLQRFGLTEADTPVVVFGSEPLLRNPSTRDLADLIGVRRPAHATAL